MGGWAWGFRESDGRHQEGMLCGGGQGAGEVSSGEVGLYGAGGTGRWKEEGGNTAPRREEEEGQAGLPACIIIVKSGGK